MADQTLKKPYHGSMIDTINSAPSADHLKWFGEQSIMTTLIPKDHDEIAAAWTAKAAELGLNDDPGVVESVMAQKPADLADAA